MQRHFIGNERSSPSLQIAVLRPRNSCKMRRAEDVDLMVNLRKILSLMP